MKTAAIFIFAFAAVASAIPVERVTKRVVLGSAADLTPAVHDDLINKVNKANLGWTAGVNSKFQGMTIAEAKKLLGVLPKTKDSVTLPAKFPTLGASSLPANYSIVDKFSNVCPSVTMIKDQSGCGSCWAVSASSAMQDRWCINSQKTPREAPILSAEEIMSCCKGFACLGNMGCNGGQLAPTWHFAKTHGIVTGGLYGDTQTCQPYTLPPCEHHVNGTRPVCKEGEYSTPKCSASCVDGESFSASKHFFQSGYSLPTVDSAMQDIFAHGSIQVAFTVYQDFLSYKSGVYQWDGSSPALGGHAVSFVGWGVTPDGTEYWRVRNSWNTDWGDNGYFNILRNRDECGIEQDMNAGYPDYSKSA